MKKVIIIDDSVVQLNLLKTFFADNFWEVYGATSAKVGYDMIFDIAPDLIITDAIMPVIGGFQLIKMVKENEIISKIPILVYSVLNPKSSKLYVKEENGEYFLSKEEGLDELLRLSNEIIEKHPLYIDDKTEIIKTPLDVENIENIEAEHKIIKPIENIFEEKYSIDVEKLGLELKNIYNFSYSDETIFKDFFNILFSFLKYNLFVINVYSFEKQEYISYFDIKDMILSPILKENILKHFKTKESVLYKKYAPNLKVITSENEFSSKLEFNFDNKEKNIANILIYSKEKNIYNEIENLEEFKEVLKKFFTARFVNKNMLNKQNPKTYEYSLNNQIYPSLNVFKNFNLKNEIYICVMQITNFSEIEDGLMSEELDVLNIKIIEKLMSQFEEREQILKAENGEYVLMLLSKNKKTIYDRLKYIKTQVETIKIDEIDKIDVALSAVNCMIDDEFNVYDAQRLALSAIEETTKEEKIVVK